MSFFRNFGDFVNDAGGFLNEGVPFGLDPYDTYRDGQEAEEAAQRQLSLDELNARSSGVPGGFRFTTSPDDGNFARQTQADIARADFERYRSTFVPLLREASATIGNATYRDEQIADSVALSRKGIESSDASFKRDLQEMGATQSQADATAYDRRLSLGGSLAEVDAANQTKRRTLDRDFSLAAGGGLRNRFDSAGGPRTL